MSVISFHVEEVTFNLPHEEHVVATWLEEVAKAHQQTIDTLTYIFCSDDYLLQINKSYLNHDYYTDIITFPYSNKKGLAGDIFISIDRIKENALEYQVPYHQELYRVMAHGVLHLAGFGDKTAEEAEIMRQQEDKALLIAPYVSRET